MSKAEKAVKELSEWFREQPHLILEHGKENDGRGIWCELSGQGRVYQRMYIVFPCLRKRNVIVGVPGGGYYHMERPTLGKLKKFFMKEKKKQND